MAKLISAFIWFSFLRTEAQHRRKLTVQNLNSPAHSCGSISEGRQRKALPAKATRIPDFGSPAGQVSLQGDRHAAVLHSTAQSRFYTAGISGVLINLGAATAGVRTLNRCMSR